MVDTQRAGVCGDVDHVIVPGFEFADVAELGGLLAGRALEVNFLRGLATGFTDVASVCVGVLLLGEAGLLDGHEATTAWMFAPELGRLYPRMSLQADAILVEDGRIATAAAFTAGLDLALPKISQHAGRDVARATARITLTSHVAGALRR